MSLLVLGILLWSVAHLIPAVAIGPRSALLDRLGAKRYRLIFSIVIVTAIVLMVRGWKTATPTLVYATDPGMRFVAIALMIVAMILFVASNAPGNIRRILRHPQLLSVIIWCAAHLLTNGDSASLVLFGGLGVWAIVQIIATNRRDGAWQRRESVPARKDVITILVGLATFAILLVLHQWISGVALIRISGFL